MYVLGISSKTHIVIEIQSQDIYPVFAFGSWCVELQINFTQRQKKPDWNSIRIKWDKVGDFSATVGATFCICLQVEIVTTRVPEMQLLALE